MPTSTHETVKTTQTTNPDGSSSNVGGIVVGVFVGLVVVGGVALYVVKQGNPLGNQQQSFQNPGNSGNADGVVDGHDNPLQVNFIWYGHLTHSNRTILIITTTRTQEAQASQFRLFSQRLRLK